VWFGGWRVNGTLSVSRSIGDEPMSQQLIAVPHLVQHDIEEDDDFIIIATDGLWDVFSPDQASQYVDNWRTEHASDPSEDVNSIIWDDNVSSALVEEAQKANSKDNVSAAVIFLKSHGKGCRNDMYEIVLSKPIED